MINDQLCDGEDLLTFDIIHTCVIFHRIQRKMAVGDFSSSQMGYFVRTALQPKRPLRFATLHQSCDTDILSIFSGPSKGFSGPYKDAHGGSFMGPLCRWAQSFRGLWIFLGPLNLSGPFESFKGPESERGPKFEEESWIWEAFLNSREALKSERVP